MIQSIFGAIGGTHIDISRSFAKSLGKSCIQNTIHGHLFDVFIYHLYGMDADMHSFAKVHRTMWKILKLVSKGNCEDGEFKQSNDPKCIASYKQDIHKDIFASTRYKCLT